MKWLVWGTGAGVMPFFLFYAIPFALGREPRQAMQLAGYIPLALIPLSLASAVVKDRLMDAELIFPRTRVRSLSLSPILGMCPPPPSPSHIPPPSHPDPPLPRPSTPPTPP